MEVVTIIVEEYSSHTIQNTCISLSGPLAETRAERQGSSGAVIYHNITVSLSATGALRNPYSPACTYVSLSGVVAAYYIFSKITCWE